MPNRNPSIDEAIGARVEAFREEAGVTQKTLALEAGISDRTYARLAIGKAEWRASKIAACAAVLGVDTGALWPSDWVA